MLFFFLRADLLLLEQLSAAGRMGYGPSAAAAPYLNSR